MLLCALQQPHTGLETQLILKRKPGVNPRSHFEFVVPAPPTPKQQFTDHTGQTSSHSPAPTACLTKTRPDSELNVKMTSEQKICQDVFFHCSDRQNLALRGWWFPLGPSDKHTDDDRCLTKTIKALVKEEYMFKAFDFRRWCRNWMENSFGLK